MEEAKGDKKTHLTKHTLQMKFMQRSVLRQEQEQLEAEQQQQIDDEHWVLDIPEFKQKETIYIMQPSYGPCEDLKFGRMSFKGFNPEIEKIMKSYENEEKLAKADARERESAVSDDEMTERYTSLIGTIGKKFTTKRHKAHLTQDTLESETEVKKKKKPNRTDNEIRGKRKSDEADKGIKKKKKGDRTESEINTQKKVDRTESEKKKKKKREFLKPVDD